MFPLKEDNFDDEEYEVIAVEKEKAEKYRLLGNEFSYMIKRKLIEPEYVFTSKDLEILRQNLWTVDVTDEGYFARYGRFYTINGRLDAENADRAYIDIYADKVQASYDARHQNIWGTQTRPNPNWPVNYQLPTGYLDDAHINALMAQFQERIFNPQTVTATANTQNRVEADEDGF